MCNWTFYLSRGKGGSFITEFHRQQPEKKLPFLGLVIKMSMFSNLQQFSYSNNRIINSSLFILIYILIIELSWAFYAHFYIY